MAIILSHFSKRPFQFESTRAYKQQVQQMKPKGLWLSHESANHPWSAFCLDAGWRDSLSHRVEFEVDVSDVLIINTDKKLAQFHKSYSNRHDNFLVLIDWEKVASNYAGIIISPYSYKYRLEIDYMWYYGWDCASGCIWELSALSELSSAVKPLIEVLGVASESRTRLGSEGQSDRLQGDCHV